MRSLVITAGAAPCANARAGSSVPGGESAAGVRGTTQERAPAERWRSVEIRAIVLSRHAIARRRADRGGAATADRRLRESSRDRRAQRALATTVIGLRERVVTAEQRQRVRTRPLQQAPLGRSLRLERAVRQDVRMSPPPAA